MKNPFIIFKSKYFVYFILILLVLFLIIFSTSIYTRAKTYSYTVVIDAGHGGIDNGSIGINGSKESELNLSYAKCLKKYCEEFGFKVVMTRTTEKGLYSPFSKNKKKDDMLKRKQIIEKAKPDFVVSIHMNSFSLPSSCGAQVFYNKDNNNSYNLAKSIQNQFVKHIENARPNCDKGDYYILNSTKYTSVIVECGFISNPKEEQLLSTNSHKQNICYSILCGMVLYLA